MRNSKRSKYRGIALLLVLTAIAMASLIGLAMLSSASLQEAVSSNGAKSASADYLSDSGLQIAEYYLQRGLANMPASWGTTPNYTIYATGLTVSGVDGSFDISAAPASVPNQYTVKAVGHSCGSNSVARTTTATVQVIRATPTYAAGFGGSTTVNTKNYFNNAQVVVNGTISPAPGASYFPGGTRTSFTSTDFSVPSSASGQINYYGGDVANGTYTTPSGAVGTAVKVVNSGAYTLTSPNTLNALVSSSNPANVFYFPGDLTISGAGVYNATFIVRGKVTLSTPNTSVVTINRQAGFPAVVMDGTLTIPNGTKNLTLNINGVTWVGSGTSWGTGTQVQGSQVNINGALLMPSSKTMAGPGTYGTFVVNYTPSNVDVINLTTATQPAIGLKLVSWSQ